MSTAPEKNSRVKVTFEHKEKLEQEYRRLLFDDLLNGRVEFSGGPYEAHIQFSNFCNMSCIMCWDGNNPKTKKTDADLLETIGEQLGPHLSIVTPYSGSEPLVLTWEQTLDMAKQYGILLCITTNVQYLDEAKFHELKDVTETLILSIDSHIPGVFDKIRPRGNSKKVFANLETTAKLCVEHNLECIVNVVFLTQNAPMLTDTLNYFADLGIQNVNVIQLLDVNGNSRMYDPLLHYSEEYLAWIKRNSIATAKARKFRLIWSVAGYAEFDFREPGFVPAKKRKAWNDDWDEKMKLFFPRFCRNAYGRLRVDSDGDVSPCCYATQGELSLGNLRNQPFEKIWNSTEAQDLRRGMFSGDVPVLCQSCRYHDLVKPFSSLPFVEQEEAGFSQNHSTAYDKAVPCLEANYPPHGYRCTSSVVFKIPIPEVSVEKFLLVVSLGGQNEEIHRQQLTPKSRENGELIFEMSPETLQSLKTNVGYWWMIWAIPNDSKIQPMRCAEVRCLIRHQDMPRLPGSSLRYSDQGFVPVSDLGGNKREGWQDPNHLPARPVAAFHGRAGESKAIVQLPDKSVERVSSGPGQPPASQKGFFGRWFSQPSKIGVKDAYLEVLSQQSNAIFISGWILLHQGAADSIEIVQENDCVLATVCDRTDIEAAYPKIESAVHAGFNALLPDEMFWKGDRYRFSIVAKRGGRVEFRCNVSCSAGGLQSVASEGSGTAKSIRNGILDV